MTIAEKEEALRNINFFVGGLTDEGINHYYDKYFNQIIYRYGKYRILARKRKAMASRGRKV